VHRVPRARERFSYFRTRCYSEGLSKARVTKNVGVGAGLSTERSYSTVTLPAGVIRGLRRTARGDWTGLLRAGAIIVGLLYTTLGYGRGVVLELLARRGVPGEG
jgi:glucosyl-dolichyl phosphate glucuronosyltransferase